MYHAKFYLTTHCKIGLGISVTSCERYQSTTSGLVSLDRGDGGCHQPLHGVLQLGFGRNGGPRLHRRPHHQPSLLPIGSFISPSRLWVSVTFRVQTLLRVSRSVVRPVVIVVEMAFDEFSQGHRRNRNDGLLPNLKFSKGESTGHVRNGRKAAWTEAAKTQTPCSYFRRCAESAGNGRGPSKEQSRHTGKSFLTGPARGTYGRRHRTWAQEIQS
jgi:hypothetical protein